MIDGALGQRPDDENPLSLLESLPGIGGVDGRNLAEAMVKPGGKAFLLKIANDPAIMEELRANPPSVVSLLNFKNFSIFDDPQTFETLAHNFILRQETFRERGRALRARLETMPLADEEELQMGLYREQIEPQARNAAVELTRKGYPLFESGFHELASGTQYMGMKNIPGIRLAVSAPLMTKLNKMGFTARIKRDADRIAILLVPTQGKNPDIHRWKTAWDEVAKQMPALGVELHGKPDPQQNFLKKQQKIKSGERVFVGEYTDRRLWIENGKVFEE